MSKKNRILMGICLIALIGLGIITSSAFAADLSFSVETKLPKNQRSKSSYFDLDMKPGQTQNLEIEVNNYTDKEITVEGIINPATTNINGVVEYGKSNTELDKTAPYNIKDIAKPKKEELTIPAKGVATYEIEVKMPEKEFDGILAGGITFSEVVKEDKKAKQKEEQQQGMAIENRYSYALALLLRENEKALDSNLLLTKVAADQVNVRNVISSDIQNPVAKYLNKLEVNYYVTKKDKSEKLYEESKKDIQMAPNSTMHLPLSLNGEKLVAGKYTMHIDAKAKEDSWKLEKDFEITAKEAKKLNEQDVSIEKDNTMMYVVIAFVCLIVLFLIILFFVLKRQKKQSSKELKKQNKGNRKTHKKTSKNKKK